MHCVCRCRKICIEDFSNCFSGLIHRKYGFHFRFIPSGFSKTQLFCKCLSDHVNVSVLTKNQRDNKPVVGCTYTSVSPMETLEGSCFKATCFWFGPCQFAGS